MQTLNLKIYGKVFLKPGMNIICTSFGWSFFVIVLMGLVTDLQLRRVLKLLFLQFEQR